MKRLEAAFLDNPDNARTSIFAPKLRRTLRTRGLYYLRLMLIGVVMIWVPMCLFFGAVYNRSNYLYRLHLDIIDLDGGFVGRNLTQHILLAGGPTMQNNMPQWRVRSELRTLDQVRKWTRVHGWGAIVINSGASERLLQAIDNSASSNKSEYDPYSAMTVVANTGRHPIVGLSNTLPALSAAARSAAIAFNVGFLQQLSSEASSAQAIVIPAAVYFRTTDAAPMTFNIAPVQTLFSFLMGTLCTVAALITWKMTTFGFFLKTRHIHLWASLFLLVLAWTLYISLNCSLAIAFFRGPHYSRNALPYTVGRFFSIWGTTLAVLMAVGLWLLSWYLLVTPEFIGLVSLITVLSNVVSALLPAQMANRFYRIFYALPFFNGSMLYRYILSGSYPRLGKNIGVLLGEIFAMALALGLASWVRQVCVLKGLADIAGWYRGSMFFSSPVPLQKQKQSQGKTQSHRHRLHMHLHRDRDRDRYQNQNQNQDDDHDHDHDRDWDRVSMSTLSIADSAEDSTSLKEGNLGV
ncbi:hypothetical protein LPJ64_005259 [Coemansia asiatica]|uniref:DUF3533 domain-containing protein n=1 Tax=Coemansia asiatica TaxID=1052880 RepID=A0A9W8CGK3_9FUNG|nr:hypothetical protein LPJ64_005259 [Coemansia asiatica]